MLNSTDRTNVYATKKVSDSRLIKSTALLLKHGIDLEQYEAMLAKQNGVCAVCFTAGSGKRALAVDHDHKTEVIRELLCVNCNVALGMLKEDAVIVTSLLRYINKYK